MAIRLYENRVGTVKREPLRSPSFPQPSSKNHLPMNDRATFDFKQKLVSTGKIEKKYYCIIDFGKELDHGGRGFQPSTVDSSIINYLARKFVWWSWFWLGTITSTTRIVVEPQIWSFLVCSLALIVQESLTVAFAPRLFVPLDILPVSNTKWHLRTTESPSVLNR